MTPQPALQPRLDASAPMIQTHLTEEQFGQLVAGSETSNDPGGATAEVHLLACEQCAAELATLRDSILLFRHAATAYAENELRDLPRIALPSRRLSPPPPTLNPAWCLLAAAVLLTAIVPTQLSRQHIRRPPPSASAAVAVNPPESDEALLTDIDRETSASVPTPMQALADPTASVSTTTASTPSSAQRKD